MRIPYILVALAVLLPILLYVRLALRERKYIDSLRQFFPLERLIDGETYGRSTAAAGVSLATVILALMNLAPILGISLIVTVSSYAIGFVALYICAPRILKANPANDTLQAFLGKAYSSGAVRNVALIFSIAGYVSIFSMELIVGATVLDVFLGDKVIAFAFLYLLFLVAYSVIGGFRAIVATEQWQIRFVVAAVIVVLLIPFFIGHSSDRPDVFLSATKQVFSSWNASWAFILGILVLNVPAAISDSGTWQRLCATSSEKAARSGLIRAIVLFFVIWGSLIFGSTYIAALASATETFDASKTTLMNYVMIWLSGDGLIRNTLLFLFVVGIFSAMITTADSLLMVAAQMVVIDALRIQVDGPASARGLLIARWTLAMIGTASFAMFAIFKLLGLDVVQLIFAIYGAQLALFPVVFAALFLSKRLALEKASSAAVGSVVLGFVSAWGSAVWGKLTDKLDWVFNAPVIGLVVATSVFVILSLGAWKRCSRSLIQ